MKNRTFPNLLRKIAVRPLSALTVVIALGAIIYGLIPLLTGSVYVESLNYIDGSTLVMVGLLLLWGTFSLAGYTDLQAVSSSLVNALSFVFAYEALFKWSFYLTPFRMAMPPPELREFVIQVGIALTVLTGFAEGRFRFRRLTWIFLGLFVIGWAVWLLVGFPQLSGQVMFQPPVLSIPFNHAMTYAINRGTKVLLFLIYLTFFPSLRRIFVVREVEPLNP